MSDIVPYEIVTMSKSKNGDDWVMVKAECSACDYTSYTGYRISWKIPADRRWIPEHMAQHAPGRALNLDISWELSACCTVCEDQIGDVIMQDVETIVCKKCGTIWNEDGKEGYLDDQD